MTKKAENMVNKLEERVYVQVRAYELFRSDFDFTIKYVKDIYEDFRSMVSNMYLFDLLSEKDYDELHDLIRINKQAAIEKLHSIES